MKLISLGDATFSATYLPCLTVFRAFSIIARRRMLLSKEFWTLISDSLLLPDYPTKHSRSCSS